MSEKLCLFCKHADFEAIETSVCGFGTCETTEGGFTCDKGHYSEERPDDMHEYRKLMLRAESCDDYERPENTNADTTP